MFLKTFPFAIFVCLLFYSCNSNNRKQVEKKEDQVIALSYAKHFSIKQSKDFTVLELLGKDKQVTASFVLYKMQKPTYQKDVYYIKTPVKRVASMSSIYSAMLIKLGVQNSIVAIDNVDYYNNPFIINQVKKAAIIELSKGATVDIEKTLQLNPDLFLTFGMANPKSDIDKKLTQSHLPLAISLDHLEQTPLARAEWIKFFSYFFDKEALADSLFNSTEKNYNELKKAGQIAAKKPKVLTEIKYGDAWYVPSGDSYMAHLIEDAGGDYFWKDDIKTGSTPLSFEQVYLKAKDCDIWINLYNLNSKKELLSYDERYGLFKAYKTNHLFNNNKTQNALGYSNYWETGIVNPDEVLKDLIHVFNPALDVHYQFQYYKKLE